MTNPVTITMDEIDDEELQSMRIIGAVLDRLPSDKSKSRVLSYWKSRLEEGGQ